MRTIGWIVGLVVTLAVAGCDSCQPAPNATGPEVAGRPPSPVAVAPAPDETAPADHPERRLTDTPGAARAARPTLPIPDDCSHRPSTPREVFQAQYAIAYYVNTALSGDADSALQPASLAQALQWLRCDPSTRRPGRQRYAATKLAAGIVALRKRHGGPSPAVINPLTNVLNGLIGPTSLVRRVSDSAATELPELEDVAGAAIDAAQDEPALVALQRTCCPCIDQCVVGPSTNESLAEFTVSVNRSPGCLFHVVDPQCWPYTTEGYFNEVFVLGNAPPCSGGGTTPVCRTASICGGSQPTPTPHANPAKAGTPWCGLVYEDVTGESGGTTVQFRNVLSANLSYMPAGATPVDATGFRLDYGLCESIFWEICDTTCANGSCPLDRDCGHAEVKDDGQTGRGLIDGSKHIHFAVTQPIDGNKWAPLALEVLVKETALAACELAADCERAATPSNCTELPRQEPCSCPPLQDHCESKAWLEQRKPTTLCPNIGP